jgi:hypothetical protein
MQPVKLILKGLPPRPRYKWWKLLVFVPPLFFTAKNPMFNWIAFAAGLLCGVFAATTLFRHGVDHAIFDEIVYAVFTPLRQSRALNRKLTEGL